MNKKTSLTTALLASAAFLATPGCNAETPENSAEKLGAIVVAQATQSTANKCGNSIADKYIRENENNPQIVKAACNLFNERRKEAPSFIPDDEVAKGALVDAQKLALGEAKKANTAQKKESAETRARDLDGTKKILNCIKTRATTCN